MKFGKRRARPAYKLPRAVLTTACALPVILAVLFYALRSSPGAMEWASTSVSAPIRGGLGFISSVFPFSIMEILCAAAVVWLLFYIVKTIVLMVRRHGKLMILLRRLLTIIVVVLYAWSLYCWLWNSGYYAPGFSDKNGFISAGVTMDELTAVTKLFAEKANEFAALVKRDPDGRYAEDRRGFFAASPGIYKNIASEFPCLDGRLYKPKPMLFSWLMSRTGYTGIYFALTGESNINKNAPLFLMPATVAHELAHQRGIFAEDEANFVGIAACVTSDDPVYEYAGWLMGLIYLSNALSSADADAWYDISGGFSAEVLRDWQDNIVYWESQKTVDTGIMFIDRILTATTETMSEAVDTVYDSFLKSQNQELGIKSYGACVDLLVEYFTIHNA